MHPNHAFCLDTAARLAGQGRILDYGCGAGETIAGGVARGLDIYGVETFYEGDPTTRERAARLLAEGRIRDMDGSRIPFPDAHFGVVFHNFVFEHVRDIDAALAEIRRVLQPGGFMLSLFPTREVLKEGHCGVPFAHRVDHGRRAAYLLAWRRMGVGYFRDGKTPEQWADDFARFIERLCFYRPFREVAAAYERAGFTLESHEVSLAAFRLRGQPWLAALARWLPGLTRAAIRRVAGVVLLSRPDRGTPDTRYL